MSCRKVINKIFKLNGLLLDAGSIKFLLAALDNIQDALQQQKLLSSLVEVILKFPLANNLITKDNCENAWHQLNSSEENVNQQVCFIVFNAFNLQKFTYCFERKKLLPSTSRDCQLLGCASDKINVFVDRFCMILQRVQRSPAFSKTSSSALQPLDYVKSGSSKDVVVVLAMLTQLTDPIKWYLEDLKDILEIDTSGCKFHQGIFSEACFVLAEGYNDDGIFHIQEMGMPITEKSNSTRQTFGSINIFGGSSPVCPALDMRMKEFEDMRGKDFLVILSDVWLDDADVIDKLTVMLAGYSSNPPLAFIFCGNFLSKATTNSSRENALQLGFKRLQQLIQEHPLICDQSHMVFVPGFADSGLAPILPLHSLPESVISSFCKRFPLATFASNPCRIQYCTQEIVVFRDNLTEKLCKHSIRRPEPVDLPGHLCRTLLSQGHLCPLPLHVSPVYWSKDHSLSIYPIPDVLIIADSSTQFSILLSDCLCISPGSFKLSGFSFFTYYPHKRLADPSKID